MIKIFPKLYYELIPTIETLIEAHHWCASCNDEYHLYVKKRLEMLSVPNEEGCALCQSSGVTGEQRKYLWGPYFHLVNKFFYHIVKKNAKFQNTTWIRINHACNKKITTFQIFPSEINDTHQLMVITIGRDQSNFYEITQHLSNNNLFVPPSVVEFLLPTQFFEFIEPRTSIFLTGEYLQPEIKDKLIKMNFDVRNYMRCWDGGASFYTCEFGNMHWMKELSFVEIIDDKLISTDLFNRCERYVNYWNGDVLTQALLGSCECGHESIDLIFRNRSDFIFFKTPSQITIDYGVLVAHLTKSAKKQHISNNNIHLASFGLGPKTIKIHYIINDKINKLDKLDKDLEANMKNWYGFENVSISREILTDGYKFKKLYYKENNDI